MNELMNREIKMTSKEVCDMINRFREMENLDDSKRRSAPMEHKSLMRKIREEIEKLEVYGITNEGDFAPVEYKDSKGEMRPCYSLNRDAIIQISMSESALVRYKIIEYINKLEEKLKSTHNPSYLIDDRLERAEAWIEEEKARRKLLSENTQMKPKVEYYDKVLDTETSFNISQIAKELGMTGIALNKKLGDMEIQYKQGGQWLLYSKYQDKGYTVTATNIYKDSKDVVQTSLRTKWTQKGREFIHKLLEKDADRKLLN